MDYDDLAPECYEHVWVLRGLHLSLTRGAELEEECGRCGALRYQTDDLRNRPSRRPLRPGRPKDDQP